MYRRIAAVAASIVIPMLSSGCMSVLNPYKSEFQCPMAKGGKCQPLARAYAESLEGGTDNANDGNAGSSLVGTEKTVGAHPRFKPLVTVDHDVFAGVAAPEEPLNDRPLRTPGVVMRVLMNDYIDRDILYASGGGGKRFIYIEVEKPKWGVGVEVNR